MSGEEKKEIKNPHLSVVGDNTEEAVDNDNLIFVKGSVPYEITFNKDTGEFNISFPTPENDEIAEQDMLACVNMTLNGVFSTVDSMKKQKIITPEREMLMKNWQGTSVILGQYLQNLAQPVLNRFSKQMKMVKELGGKKPANHAQKPKPKRTKGKKTHRKK